MRSTARTSDPIALTDLPAFRGTVMKHSVEDVIANEIACLIASGVPQVGDHLPSERDLAASPNASRETVRGAIQVLGTKGVIGVSHGGRTRVLRADMGSIAIGGTAARATDTDDLDAVHAGRMPAEHQVVADAAWRADEALFAELEASLDARRAAGPDAVRFLIADREFQVAIDNAIDGASGNPPLADLTTSLYASMPGHRRIAVSRPGAIATSLSDHVAFVAALRSHDAERAVAAFAAHTYRIYNTIQALSDQSDPDRDRR